MFALIVPYIYNCVSLFPQECISCCEGMVCNVEVPTNHTNAVFAMRQQVPSSAGSHPTAWAALSLLAPVLTGALPLL